MSGKKNVMGEDAFFVSDRKTAIGVFDGVGGWNDEDIDPSAYSNRLAKETKKFYDSFSIEDPMMLFQRAAAEAQEVQGSSTGCVIAVKRNMLTAANLGDSRFMVIRRGEVVLLSEAQQVAFNMPFQVGHKSPQWPATHGQVYTCGLKLQDVIVMGSDGLFDNLFIREIVEYVKEDLSCNKLARSIGNAAKKRSISSDVETPFKEEALKADLVYTYGGKPDDITIIVSRVV